MKKHSLIDVKIWKTTHREIFPTFTFTWVWIDAIQFTIWFDFNNWWKEINET